MKISCICKFSKFILQVAVDEEDPGQEEPPFLGGGLLHDLDLAFVPVNMLHEPQAPQILHAPLTGPLIKYFD